MRTEIVVPFAFDTAPIEQKLQDEGYKLVMSELKRAALTELVKCVPKRTDHYRSEPDWVGLMRDWFMEWLDQHADEIIEDATLLLAKKAGDRRRWRDALREMREEQDG